MAQEHITSTVDTPTVHLKHLAANEQWPENTVVFGWDFTWKSWQAMYFSGLTVYDFFPTKNELQGLLAQGRKVVLCQPGPVPDNLKAIPGVRYLQLPE